MKEYTVAVPLMNGAFRRADRAHVIGELKAQGVRRVFLALRENCLLSPLREEELADLRENCALLQKEGFEVGAWLWTFLLKPDKGYTRMEAPDGKVSAMTICPMDGAYTAEMGGLLEEVARCGVRLIMFDDDFRYGFQDMGFGCTCGLHKRRLSQILGRQVPAEELRDRLLSGGPNEVREAFIRANGEALETFAAAMRSHVDAVDPEIRMGFCACITSWDLDGTAPDRLSRILAGRTRPFYRLIGAPYWAAGRHWGHRLGDVISLERIECARRTDREIEVFSEGDTYPRPRFKTPAAFLEIFDVALRAAGCTDGILKYMQDYTAAAGYETGYYEAARRNADAYAAVRRFFDGKTGVGVRCWDKPDKYRAYSIPEQIAGTCGVQELAFSATARFLAANSVPAVFEGEGVIGAAFGDDALAVPDAALQNGMILDVSAAVRLTERGIDVGVCAFGEAFQPEVETYGGAAGRVAVPGGAAARALTLSPAANVLSTYVKEDGTVLPLSFEYRNAAGQRFLIFAFEGYFAGQDWFRQYTRQAQIEAFVSRCGKRLPAFCPGHPELFVLAGSDGESLAVGLWNIFPDPVYAPTVRVDRAYALAEGFRCEPALRGNVVTLQNDIPPYGFAFVLLHENAAGALRAEVALPDGSRVSHTGDGT